MLYTTPSSDTEPRSVSTTFACYIRAHNPEGARLHLPCASAEQAARAASRLRAEGWSHVEIMARDGTPLVSAL